MANPPEHRGAFPRPRVDLRAADERSYWCVMFNCTEEELREAVNAVGVVAVAIERYLEKKKARSTVGRTAR